MVTNKGHFPPPHYLKIRLEGHFKYLGKTKLVSVMGSEKKIWGSDFLGAKKC